MSETSILVSVVSDTLFDLWSNMKFSVLHQAVLMTYWAILKQSCKHSAALSSPYSVVADMLARVSYSHIQQTKGNICTRFQQYLYLCSPDEFQSHIHCSIWFGLYQILRKRHLPLQLLCLSALQCWAGSVQWLNHFFLYNFKARKGRGEEKREDMHHTEEMRRN